MRVLITRVWQVKYIKKNMITYLISTSCLTLSLPILTYEATKEIKSPAAHVALILLGAVGTACTILLFESYATHTITQKENDAWRQPLSLSMRRMRLLRLGCLSVVSAVLITLSYFQVRRMQHMLPALGFGAIVTSLIVPTIYGFKDFFQNPFFLKNKKEITMCNFPTHTHTHAHTYTHTYTHNILILFIFVHCTLLFDCTPQTIDYNGTKHAVLPVYIFHRGSVLLTRSFVFFERVTEALLALHS